MKEIPNFPRAALDQHIAITGKTGSGKTVTAKVIVEHLLREGRQVCVIDPTAAWWGLRLAADGKSKGFDVVLIGGDHADIPLSERSGAACARLVTQQHASVIIDTSGLTVGQYTQWFIDFAGKLYTTINEPLYLVIDEAHTFMPQGKVPDPQAGRMLHAGNRLMSGGRSRGIRAIMITQRPAKFHKDSLTCADTLIAMRVIAPQDRKAIKEWIDGAGDPASATQVLNSLAGLTRGESWTWYPEGNHILRSIWPKMSTFDSSAAPKHGAKRVDVGEIDLTEVKAAMAEAVKEAEANDPKLLRAEITKLKAELSKLLRAGTLTPPKDQKAIERAVAARDREWQKAIDEHDRNWRAFVKKSNWIWRDKIIGACDGVAKNPELIFPEKPGLALPTVAPRSPASRELVQAPARREPSCASAQNGLTQGQRTVMVCILQHGSVDRSQLGINTGYAARTLSDYVTQLKGKGCINVSGGQLEATEDGRAAVGHYEPLPTGEALRLYWCQNLPSGEASVLQAACNRHPRSIPRDDLQQETDYAPRTLSDYVTALKRRKLVTTGLDGVRASDQLF